MHLSLPGTKYWAWPYEAKKVVVFRKKTGTFNRFHIDIHFKGLKASHLRERVINDRTTE